MMSVVWNEQEARRSPRREVEPLWQVPKFPVSLFCKEHLQQDLSLEKQGLGRGSMYQSWEASLGRADLNLRSNNQQLYHLCLSMWVSVSSVCICPLGYQLKIFSNFSQLKTLKCPLQFQPTLSSWVLERSNVRSCCSVVYQARTMPALLLTTTSISLLWLALQVPQRMGFRS